MLKVIIGIILIIGVLFTWYSFTPKSPQTQQTPVESDPSPKAGTNTIKSFYSKGGLSLNHTWPGEEHFSNEETEILIFNESDTKVEVKSFDLTYEVESKIYPQKSGTWEKFPSTSSWDRMEYINISKQHYQNQPLNLAQGEKGKLHWHINFGPQPLSGKQTVTIKITLLKNGQTINIDEQFTRDSGEVFSKDEH